jgi:diaminopimelate decarboxylase
LAGRTLEMIDFGGGFGVPYFDRMPEFDLDRFGQGFQELAAAYRPDPLLNDCRFIFELGRYLVADAGIYVTQVVDVKRSRDKTFVVTDGGMNHHLAATGNLGQVFRKPYPLLNLSGAYGLSASNLHFLSHPTPAEILLWQGDAHLLRAPGSPEDVLAGQQPLEEPSDASTPPRPGSA